MRIEIKVEEIVDELCGEVMNSREVPLVLEDENGNAHYVRITIGGVRYIVPRDELRRAVRA